MHFQGEKFKNLVLGMKISMIIIKTVDWNIDINTMDVLKAIYFTQL